MAASYLIDMSSRYYKAQQRQSEGERQQKIARL
jgi:hypothetical protein